MRPLLVLLLLARAQEPPPRVPQGFTIEKVSPADLAFPMFAAFDDRGRLYVAESSGGDLYVELQKLVRTCRIRRLEDRDGDGRFETSAVFAEGLTPSMGLAWREGKLYVADPPDLAVLEDSDGDGKADRRSVIQTDFGHQDNGSLHGLVFGPDGLLYGTMGQPDGYRLRRADGSVLTGTSGMLFRCRPDGSHPEVLARGFENLVEIEFLPRGEIVGTCNWYQKPVGGIRDAIVHLVDGGLYPYVPDQGTAQPVTGGFIPPLALFPAVAVSGMARLRGAVWPEEFRGHLFTAQHNSRKVMRHALRADGASFASQDFDFVSSESPDFHPSDVLEDADGSLLVVDTGAWYVQHCPTGKIRNSRAPGAIWRVRRAGTTPPADPWGLATDWSALPEGDLAKLLSDPRPAVQERAQRTLIARGDPAVAALAASPSPLAPWALAQIPGEKALEALRKALPDPLAARALALRAGKAVAPDLVRMLDSEAPVIRMAAAEALARCGTPESLPAVWKALASNVDAFLEHALVLAAHRLAGAEALGQALDHPHPRVQKAALVLLEQRSGAPQDAVLRRVVSPDPALRRAAFEILQRHRDWAAPVIALVRGWIASENLGDDESQSLRTSILAFQSDVELQKAVAEGLRADPWKAFRPQRAALEALAETSLPRFPAAWSDGLRAHFPGGLVPTTPAALRVLTALRLPGFEKELETLAATIHRPLGGETARLMALRALVLHRPRLGDEFTALATGHLGAGEPTDRLLAAEVLARAHLTDAQLAAALKAVRGNALFSPSSLLPSLRESSGPEAALALVSELEEAVRTGWRPSGPELDALLDRMSPDARAKAAPLREAVARPPADLLARLEKHAPLVAGGDPAKGREVFFGRKVACSTCHAVGPEGGRIGPDLTKIGAVRAGRDLLESIVVPGSTFAQGYESWLVLTKDGDVLSGLLARQDGEGVVLRDAAGAETRIRRDRIQELKRGSTSIMPEGLERNLTETEFRDLLAYLQSLR
jgi:putative membrane-bound dehydrogenase-like protein